MKLEIRYVPTEYLVPYARNAKQHPPEQIAQIAGSLKEFGFINPVVVDKDRSIVAGHGRVLAAQKLGMTEVPTISAEHLTAVQVKAFRLADNRIAQNGSWDDDLLKLELEELDNLGIDLESLGFDLDELPSSQGTEGLTDPDDVPETPKDVWVKPGDLFELGAHRLLCGDSTKQEDVARLMNGEKADITFTSPPYNAAKESHLNGRVAGFDEKYGQHNDAMDDDEYRSFLSAFTVEALAISKYVFVNLQMLAHNRGPLIDYPHDFRDKLKDILIWNKRQAPPNIVKGAFNTKFEFVFCFSEDRRTRGFPVSWQGQHPNVVETESNSGNEFADQHKAGFPVAFPLWFLEKLDFANTVYEPFCGTGTTLIACENTGRRCYGMEIDPTYCQVILERWAKFTGKQWTKIES